MIYRNFALILCAASFALAGCNKIPNPFAKKETAPPAGEVSGAPGAVAPKASSPDIAIAQPSSPDMAIAPAKAAPPGASAKSTIDTTSQVVVLCYHRLEGKAGGGLSIEPALFEQQMAKIKEAGLAVISMPDYLAFRRGEKSIPPKCVIITIDDGYVSSYEVGWPILKKYGYPFTMYVYLDFINKGGKSITWAQLAEMRDSGVDIGSHTISHQDLRRKGKGTTDADAFLKDEVERSKAVLEEKLGIKVLSIAYPFGLNNDKVHAATKAAGYEAGLTTYGARLGHNTPAFALGRYDVTTKDAQGRDSFSVAISFQGMMAPGADPASGQEAAVSMVTKPMNGETIRDDTPDIKANLSTMGGSNIGEIDPASIKVRISGVGEVPAKYDPATKMLTYTVTPAQKLKPGGYSVLVSATAGTRKLETRWAFKVDPNSLPDQPAPPLPPR